jgi:protein-S-isoprenylcysteine O-methyltransferase Ste14
VTLSRYRVPAGYVVGLLVILLARPRPSTLLAGSAVAVLGEVLRVWASGHIEKTRALATGGPYAHSRNPLYVGSLLLALGVAVASASPWVLLAVAGYFAAFYPAVMREEAAFLEGRFGAAYREWAAAVPLFFPRLTPGGARASRFSWARVRMNREWEAALALPVVVALLYARGRWGP